MATMTVGSGSTSTVTTTVIEPTVRKENQLVIDDATAPRTSLNQDRGLSDANEPPPIPKGQAAAVIVTLFCVTSLGTLLAGLLTVALPVIAHDLEMDNSLQLWPAAIYSLTCGCSLLLLGAVADVVGCRRMYLIGTLLQSAFTLACGLAKNSTQLIVFRGLAGVAASFCLPSAVSIVTHTFPVGPRRNIAFSTMGSGQPIGFSLGLTLGGVFADKIGWRWGFYIGTILNSIMFLVAVWTLPQSIDGDEKVTFRRLKTEVDWIGAILLSTSLALLSYVFILITGSTSAIRSVKAIVMLVTAVALIPAFAFWVSRQVRLSRPALIPNSLWRNIPFTTIMLTVFLIWGCFNSVEQLIAFYFEYVRRATALETSFYLLPAPVSGALTNLAVGIFLPRLRPNIVAILGCLTAGLSPLLLAALARTDGPSYWACAFPAIFANPAGADALWTIANLLVTDAFSGKTQALAGGVFNTIAQIGKSVGLATTAVIAARITAKQAGGHAGKEDLEALLDGYKAAWWYGFALSVAAVGICAWGLKDVKRLGVKRE